MRVRSRPASKWPLVILALLVLSLVLYGFEVKAKPTFMAIAEKKAEIIAIEALNRAVDEKVINSVDYTDLIRIERTNNGHVSHMVPNVMELNRLITVITLSVQEELKSLRGREFGIPLGELLGSRLFAIYGPRLNVGMIPLGTVSVQPVETFEEAGINQVRHSIYVEATVRIQVVIPLSRRDIEIVSQFPVAEAIVVGPVPMQYLQFYWGR